MHRRERDLADDDEFRAMVQQVCDDVPVNPDTILRANRAYIVHYLKLAAD